MGVCSSKRESSQQKELYNFIKKCFPDQFVIKQKIIISQNIQSLEELNAKIHTQQQFPIQFSVEQFQNLQAIVEGRIFRYQQTQNLQQINSPLLQSRLIDENNHLYDYPNMFIKTVSQTGIKQIILFGMNDLEKQLLINNLINSYLGVQFFDTFRYSITPVQHNQLKLYQINQEIVFINVEGFNCKKFRQNRELLREIYYSLKELKLNPDLILFIAPFTQIYLSQENIQLIQNIFEIFKNNFHAISRLRVILTNYDSSKLILTAYETEDSVFRQLTYLIERSQLYFGVNNNCQQHQNQVQLSENNYKTIEKLTDYIKDYQTNQEISILSGDFLHKNREFIEILELEVNLKHQMQQLKVEQFNLQQIEPKYLKYNQQEVDLEDLKTDWIDHMNSQESEQVNNYLLDEFLKDIINSQLNDEEEQILNNTPLLQTQTGNTQFMYTQKNVLKELQRLKLKLNNYYQSLSKSIDNKEQFLQTGKWQLIKRIVQHQASTPWPCYGLSMEQIDEYLQNVKNKNGYIFEQLFTNKYIQ